MDEASLFKQPVADKRDARLEHKAAGLFPDYGEAVMAGSVRGSKEGAGLGIRLAR
jgi:hypothetical protein